MSYEVIIDLSDVEHRSFDFKRMFDESIPCKERIVRCRDCLKWDYDSPYPKKACFEFSNPEDGYIVMTSPDGFCAWPERRTE